MTAGGGPLLSRHFLRLATETGRTMKYVVYARDGRDNNFHIIRHLAALAVVLTHSHSILTGRYESEPLVGLLGRSIGHYAVDVFFILSGFVVTQSLLRDKDLLRFTVARVLRIFPALVFAVIATVFVLGPIVSTYSAKAYFADPATWSYLAGAASTLAVDGTLPGVFADSPERGVINVPLWTLKYELAAYAMLAGFAVISFYGSRVMLAVALAGSAAVYVIGRTYLPWETESFVSNALHLSLSFMIGAAAYVLRRHIPLTPIAIMALFAITYTLAGTMVYELSEKLLIAYALMWLAFLTPKDHTDLSCYGDMSYGIYIFAFPLQQTLFLLLPNTQPLTLFVLSVVVTVPVALFSWHVIEKPSMALRGSVVALLQSMIAQWRRSAPVRARTPL